jgi:2-oxoglutarate ferredoxin oxidoreductase subunit alpha
MQAIWGTHGDHPVIVLTASHVRDAFEMTVRAFNLAERHRVPVILLLDEVVAHMRENIEWPAPGELEVVTRRAPDDVRSFRPFADDSFLPFGAGARFHVTGLAHGADGFAVQGEAAARELVRIMDKIHSRAAELAVYEAVALDDAEAAIVSYGVTSRAAEAAVARLRAAGVRAGMLDLKTLWPFPEHLIRELAGRVERIVVPELNLGQLVREVERAVAGRCEVRRLGRIDGHLVTPEQLGEAVRAGAAHPARERAAT